MKKSTKNLVSTKTENATGNGCSLTWMDIGITNAQFAVEKQKTMTAVRPVLTTAPTAVQRWMVMGMAELLQKVNRNEKSICGKCIHRFVCFGTKNQPCFECNRFMEELVHCKDCKHWSDGVAGCSDHVKCCKIGFYMVGENGYCVYGERKADEQDNL